MNRFLQILSLMILWGCSSDDPIGSGTNDPTNPGPGGNDMIDDSDAAPCMNGMADIYPCNGYDLIGHLSLGTLGGNSGNDCWGWTDPDSGKEYALMGLDNGTAFVDVSGEAPLLLGTLPTATMNSGWRDIKVYQNHAFVVSEAQNHGMQVFDLTRLRTVTNPPQVFEADARYDDFGNAHNVVINEESGFAYAVGTSTFTGGGHFVDIQDPQNPVAAGGHAANGYTHDAQVIIYNGPDTDYTGSEIYVGSNEDQVVIIDVTDKQNPQEISTIVYTNVSYTHQGWFTDDQRYFIVGDELDELDFGFNSRTLIFDLSDLDNPSLYDTYNGPTAAVDHNGYVVGDRFYLANYTAGLRILDISDIEGRNIVEEGFFDSHPSDDDASFNGVWSVYPYFESGKIIVSDVNRGLFVIRKSN